MKKAIIVGGGFTGCTMAYLLKKKGFNVVLFEASDVLGGGCRTFFYRGHPYTFGPHHLIMRTGDDETLNYFKKFLDFRKLEHYVLTFPNGENTFYNYPPLKSDIYKMSNKNKIFSELESRNINAEIKNFEDYWTNSLGKTLYEMFVKEYSKKMWDIKNNKELDQDLSFSVKKQPIRESFTEYFEEEKYALYPINLDGYNKYFSDTTSDIEVHYNRYVQNFDLDKNRIFVKGEWLKYDILISTTSPDILLEFQFGELKYMGRDLLKVILPIERITPEPYYFLYYAGDEPYTRIFEYKLFTKYKSKDTLIGIEFPSKNNKLYPYPTKAEVERAKRYFCNLPQNVFSMGRLGEYKYKDIYEVYKDCKEVISKI